MIAPVRPDAVVALVLRSGHPSAGGIEVLAVTRRGRPDDWNLPGGKIDPGEAPRSAVLRELLEETGIIGRGLVRCHQASDGTGLLVRAYLVGGYEVVSRQREEGINVGWKMLHQIVGQASSFHMFNQTLFVKMGLL